MKSYIAYTDELHGYEDVSATVKTVERIAASHIHVLKEQVAALDAYVAEVAARIYRVSDFHPKLDSPLMRAQATDRTGMPGKRAVVLMTGDMGLVGGLWHGLINKLLEKDPAAQVIVVGTKGASYVREEKIPVEKSFEYIPDNIPDAVVGEITGYLFEQFTDGVFSRVDIIYPKFFSLGHQEPVVVQFLPFVFTPITANFPVEQKIPAGQNLARSSHFGFPIFEPSKAVFFDRLIQKYAAVFFRRIAAETKLSELAARTVAMEHASVKTDELIRKVKLDFAKGRHRLITQKQLESFSAHAR